MLYFIVEPNNTVLYWIAIEIIPKLHVYQQQRDSHHHQYLHGAEAADIPLGLHKHPLGQTPPAYQMITIDMHRKQMHVLWG